MPPSTAELKASLKLWEDRLERKRVEHRRVHRELKKIAANVALRTKQIASRKSKATRGELAVRVALKDAKDGVHEIPNGSNWGGRVQTYLQSAGIGAAPWCGAAYRFWANGGGFKVSQRAVYVPYIVADAKAGRGGFKEWIPKGSARRVPAGAAVIMDFGGSSDVGEHVGILRRPTSAAASSVPTIEGNTSPGAGGSQDNGQGVYARTRPSSCIVGYAVAG